MKSKDSKIYDLLGELNGYYEEHKDASIEKLAYDGNHNTANSLRMFKLSEIYEKINASVYDRNVEIKRFDLEMRLNKRLEIFDSHTFTQWVKFAMSNGYISFGNNYHVLKNDCSRYYIKRSGDNTKYTINVKMVKREFNRLQKELIKSNHNRESQSWVKSTTDNT